MERCDSHWKRLESVDDGRGIIYMLGQMARVECDILLDIVLYDPHSCLLDLSTSLYLES